MKTTICALITVIALGLISMPTEACQRECEAQGKKYSHGAKWNGQPCVCEAVYSPGESRSGPPAYYDCDWK